jgi:hypothetical protein
MGLGVERWKCKGYECVFKSCPLGSMRWAEISTLGVGFDLIIW